MENWKERFRNQFVDTYGEKDSKEWRIAYQPIEELEDFISQELDKAREEGRKELLTQPQTEEETKLVMPPSAYEQAEKEGYDMRKKVKSELIPEDTPEENEEWRKKWEDLFSLEYGYSTWGEMPIYKEELLDLIQQLLEDREREAKIEVLTEIFQTCYQEDSRTLELVEEKLAGLRDI